jgi:hypothetical protein
VSGAACREPLSIARPVALEHGVELIPVDRAEAVMLACLIPAQLAIGNAQSEEMRLWHGDVDEALTQLVVAEALDLPAHRLRRMPGVRVARPEHHD